MQFARGPRRKENFMGPMDRPGMPRPRRSIFRMMVSGLPETSWQVSNPSPFFTGVPGPFLAFAHVTCFFLLLESATQALAMPIAICISLQGGA